MPLRKITCKKEKYTRGSKIILNCLQYNHIVNNLIYWIDAEISHKKKKLPFGSFLILGEIEGIFMLLVRVLVLLYGYRKLLYLWQSYLLVVLLLLL